MVVSHLLACFVLKDADLPAIMEDSEPASTMVFDQQLPQGNISDGALPSLGSVASEDMSTYPSSNEERAIVLYKPVETPAILSSPPTNVALSFSSDFINGLKSKHSIPPIAYFFSTLYAC